MSKIRLIEGYHDRKNIQYYRDYEIKNREFLQNENLSDIQLLTPYFLNSSDKFKYDYYSATWYDKDNDDYDTHNIEYMLWMKLPTYMSQP